MEEDGEGDEVDESEDDESVGEEIGVSSSPAWLRNREAMDRKAAADAAAAAAAAASAAASQAASGCRSPRRLGS